MDTSPEYVKMCEQATEIQVLREGIIGNLYFDALDQYTYCLGALRKDGVNEFVPLKVALENDIRYTWLPRQDQLQEMVKRRNTRELLMRFTDWVEKATDYRRESMEQLWLAFVMKEKYRKIWMGGRWGVDGGLSPCLFLFDHV